VDVQKSATFLVLINSLENIDDLKADDLGVWTHKGKPARKFKVSCLDGAVYGAELTTDEGSDVYELTRVYYHHKHTPTF